jgi:ATP-dependent RNA helicase SUPV3L1/SUV3
MNIHSPHRSILPAADRARRVTAVLGPTNTGKTHLAIERMLGHTSGIIGLPLRLLAREVYGRIVEKAGVQNVALITGEEKIKPPNPKYWVATVEAMPRDLKVAFVAIDEIQLAADLDRGHVFTDRLLNRRGTEETMIIGAETMRKVIERLLPGVHIASRPRLSELAFAGERKLSRLPRRSAIVAFSAEEVYAIAELIRRQRGGAAVVMGALSPRTRNAQIDMYQAGDVDYIVATDAVGMGLNLDVDHVAFAGDKKFDGWQYRRLNPAEFGQIAGRAGRHLRDGTFGSTGRCAPFDAELASAIENHRFDAVPILQWRNSELDFSSIARLQQSLEREPGERGLTRAPLAEDVMVLDILAKSESVQRNAKTNADIGRLWDACQVPDYRKASPSAHADLVLTLFGYIVRAGHVPESWFQRHLSAFDRTDGDIDVLSARIAQVRTFNYIANRPDWLNDPEHWQNVTRQVEDNLSDALHERLAQRFVDRRTSVLMRRLRENAMLEAEITPAGDVMVEGQHVGVLHGFRFTADPRVEGEALKTFNAAAQKALAAEIEGRSTRVGNAVDEAFVLARDGAVRWLGEVVGTLAAGDHILKPRVRILADEQLSGAALEAVQRRLDLWIEQHVKKLLGSLLELETGEGLDGLARGIAFQTAEALGVLDRNRIARELRELDQSARGSLRKLGIRFGAYHIYLPQLLKPAPRTLAAQLWALKNDKGDIAGALEEVAHLASSGRTSFAANQEIARELFLAAGFKVCGLRAVRVDILERLADLIRPAVAYRPGQTTGEPPAGTADRDGFVITVAMTSLAGCAGEDFNGILEALGYSKEQRKGPAITVPLLQAAAQTPVVAKTTQETGTSAEGPVPEPDTETALQSPEVAAAEAGHPEAAAETDIPATHSAEAVPQAVSGDAPRVEGAADAAPGEPVPEVPAASVPLTLVAESFAGEETLGEAQTQPGIAAANASGETVHETQGPSLEAAPSATADRVVGEAESAKSEEGDPASAELAAEANGEAVEELIDVWRPRRGPKRNDQRGRAPRRDQQHGSGQRQGARQGRGQGQGQGQGHRQVADPNAEQGSAPQAGADGQSRPVGDGAANQDRGGQGHFRNRRDADRNRGGNPGESRPDASAPGKKFGGRKFEGKRFEGKGSEGKGRGGPKGRDGGNRGGRTFASTERPAGRDRQPDPDSPFAKLLALKEQLQNKDGKD